jgi:hypothetical protein
VQKKGKVVMKINGITVKFTLYFQNEDGHLCIFGASSVWKIKQLIKMVKRCNTLGELRDTYKSEKYNREGKDQSKSLTKLLGKLF